MYTLIIKEHFDAAHFLENYTGKCANIHGHTWYAEVEIEGENLDKTGMVADFGDVKKIIKSLLPDHEFLNRVLSINPTAENLSKHFFMALDNKFKDKNFRVKSVTVWESPTCGCRYSQ